MDENILLAGCVEPNLKDERLQESLVVPPRRCGEADAAAGEIADLSQVIEKLSGTGA